MIFCPIWILESIPQGPPGLVSPSLMQKSEPTEVRISPLLRLCYRAPVGWRRWGCLHFHPQQPSSELQISEIRVCGRLKVGQRQLCAWVRTTSESPHFASQVTVENASGKYDPNITRIQPRWQTCLPSPFLGLVARVFPKVMGEGHLWFAPIYRSKPLLVHSVLSDLTQENLKSWASLSMNLSTHTTALLLVFWEPGFRSILGIMVLSTARYRGHNPWDTTPPFTNLTIPQTD